MPSRDQKTRVTSRRTGTTASRSKRKAAAASTDDRLAKGPAPARAPTLRVAIVGGGCAGVTAAWYLSKEPGIEVSVYERSWRLGGKGASGRAPDGRILEHGLHVWLGFYENAFAMIRDCYKEVEVQKWGPERKEPDARLAHARFDDAFFPEPHIGVTGLNAGTEVVWSGLLPPEKGLPGDPLDAETNPFTLANYLVRCAHLLKTLMLSLVGVPAGDVPGNARPDARSTLDQTIDLDFSFDPTTSPELLIQSISGRVRDGTLTVAAAILQAVTILENIFQDLNHSPQVAGSVLNLMKALAGQARKQLRDFVAIDPRLRWKTEIIDIVMTITVGLYRDRVLLGTKGLDAINDLDYREWLLKHGLTKSAHDSPFITGIYDLVFAYQGGDRRKPKLAAGVALRGALRMFFTYRGAMFWRMRSGMGDAVFAPLYKVMTRPERKHPKTGSDLRPVNFHFLHELSDVAFDFEDKERRFVTRLTFKAPTLPSGAKSHRVTNPGRKALDHFGCWPDSPRPMMAATSASKAPDVREVLKDFDVVIFAMGLDDLAGILKGRLDDPKVPKRWRDAFAPGQTVATKAAQVWLGSDLEELGWYRGSGIITALGRNFDTWADMTHTLSTESAWRFAAPEEKKQSAASSGYTGTSKPAPRSVAYFCGVLSDDDIKREQHTAPELSKSVTALLADIAHIWPAAGRSAPAMIRPLEQHVQANVTGSDRYSLSVPGTIATRISPLDRSVLNMIVAGDWTACGLDAGCVEAAVMSGMLAAHAVTGRRPSLESIVGYDHP